MATAVIASKASLNARPAQVYGALLAGMLCISFTAIFTKWAAAPGPISAAYRMAIAAVALTIPFLRQRRRGASIRTGWPWAVLAGFWFALNLGFLNTALLMTSAATATLLDNTAPIWVGIGATVLFRERLRSRYWVGMSLALAGAAVVTGFSPANGFALNHGDLIAFVGAAFYAGYLLTTQRARRELNSLSFLWLAALSAAVILFSASLALHLPLAGYSTRSYAALLAVGIFSQAGGWLLISYALGYLPASTAVIVLLCQPVVTSILSIPLLGEALATQQIVGGALALTGIYLCLKRAGRAPTSPAGESTDMLAGHKFEGGAGE